METTVKALAEEMAKALVTATRDDGGEYVRFADSRPDWMADVMREAHGDMLPDDHRYEMAREAVGLAAEAEDEDEYRELVTEVDPPIYNADLCEWLSSHAARAEYADEAARSTARRTSGSCSGSGWDGWPSSPRWPISCGRRYRPRPRTTTPRKPPPSTTGAVHGPDCSSSAAHPRPTTKRPPWRRAPRAPSLRPPLGALSLRAEAPPERGRMTDEPKTVLFVRGFPRWLKAAMHEEAEKNVLEGGQFRGQREIIVDALERRYRDDRRENP